VAHHINTGAFPRFGGQSQDCFFLPATTPAEAADLVVELVTERLPARYGFKPGDVQVLVPMHRGEVGVGTLNQRLQERLTLGWDGRLEARVAGRVYRVGDRVLQSRNDDELEVFNGDLGTVEALNPIEQELLLRLDDGREVALPVRQPVCPDARVCRLGSYGTRGRVPCDGHAAGDEPRTTFRPDATLHSGDTRPPVSGVGRPTQRARIGRARLASDDAADGTSWRAVGDTTVPVGACGTVSRGRGRRSAG